MAERTLEQQTEARTAFDSYVRDVAGSDPATSLATAAQLHDQGKISDDEYAKLKAKIIG